MSCTGNCNQGRACTCAEREDLSLPEWALFFLCLACIVVILGLCAGYLSKFF